MDNFRFNMLRIPLFSIMVCMAGLMYTTTLFSQNEAKPDDKVDPRLLVKDLATQASVDQIEVQNQIKLLQVELKDLKSQRSKSKNVQVKADLKKAQSQKESDLLTLQNDLKTKMVSSKKYRDMLSLPDEQLYLILAKDHPEILKFKDTGDPGNLPATGTNDLLQPHIKADSIDTSKIIMPTESGVTDLSTNRNSKQKFDDWITLNPVSHACKYQEKLSTANKAIEPELLFTYTPDEIKKHLRGTPYCKGTAFVGREPGYIYLQIDIEIASDLALQYYGNLSKSFFIIRLVNGKEVRLINSRFDAGKIDPKKRTTTMSGMYYIDKNAEKVLSGSELDTMRLNFASGYEDYVIYNVDFFTRQLTCLNDSK